jgi:HSP20 family molecular chaperone IbpA
MVKRDGFSPSDVTIRNFLNVTGGYLALAEDRNGYPIDVYEDGYGLNLEITCTGRGKEDVDLKIEGGTLRVRYETKTVNEETRHYIRRGVMRRTFDMGFRLSNRYNIGGSKATFSNGLLYITVPFTEQTPVVLAID